MVHTVHLGSVKSDLSHFTNYSLTSERLDIDFILSNEFVRAFF